MLAATFSCVREVDSGDAAFHAFHRRMTVMPVQCQITWISWNGNLAVTQ